MQSLSARIHEYLKDYKFDDEMRKEIADNVGGVVLEWIRDVAATEYENVQRDDFVYALSQEIFREEK